MPESTAIDAIDETIGGLHQNTPLHVLLMGGEPFLEFGMIRNIVDHTSIAHRERDVKFKLVTNGTLVHGEVQDWLLNHRHMVDVELSLDGVESTHNQFRNNSFKHIDLAFFLTQLQIPTVSMVVIPETLPEFAKNVIYLSELGFNIKCSLADGVKWVPDVNAGILAEQLKLLADYFLQKPEAPDFNLLSLATYAAGLDDKPARCCPGINASAVEPSGQKRACHRTGSLYNHGSGRIPDHVPDLSEIEFLNAACRQCCIRNVCQACPASIALAMQNAEMSEAKCRMSKVMFMANAYFHIQLLTGLPQHRFIRHKSDKQKLAMLRGSRKILGELNPQTAF